MQLQHKAETSKPGWQGLLDVLLQHTSRYASHPASLIIGSNPSRMANEPTAICRCRTKHSLGGCLLRHQQIAMRWWALREGLLALIKAGRVNGRSALLPGQNITSGQAAQGQAPPQGPAACAAVQLALSEWHD